jgi:hypothetical protein
MTRLAFSATFRDARVEILDEKPDEARRWIAKAADLKGFVSEADLSLLTGNAHELSGDPSSASQAYERACRMTEQKARLYSHDHYRLASLYARLSTLPGQGPRAATPSASDESPYGARAVDEARKAAAAGYASPARFRTDPNLDPLRSRTDFRELLMDLAFPAEPFDP